MLWEARKNRLDIDAEVKLRFRRCGCADAWIGQYTGHFAGGPCPVACRGQFRRVVAKNSEVETTVMPARGIEPGLAADIIEQKLLSEVFPVTRRVSGGAHDAAGADLGLLEDEGINGGGAHDSTSAGITSITIRKGRP